MKRLGICSVDGSQDNYHRAVDRIYERRKAALKSDDGDVVDGAWHAWNVKIPPPPDDWPDGAALKLDREQAEFLRDQVSLSAPASLFALLARLDTAPHDVEYPWAHPRREMFSDKIVWQLDHAQNISEVMHGAPLLYNLILAELTSNEDLIEEYQSKLASWADMLTGRMSVLRKWDRNDAWTCVESEGAACASGHAGLHRGLVRDRSRCGCHAGERKQASSGTSHQPRKKAEGTTGAG